MARRSTLELKIYSASSEHCETEEKMTIYVRDPGFRYPTAL